MNIIRKIKRKISLRAGVDSDSYTGEILNKLKKKGSIKRALHSARTVTYPTVDEISRILGTETPDTVQGDKRAKGIACAVKMSVRGGAVFLLDKKPGDMLSCMKNSMDRNVAIIYADSEVFSMSGLNATDYPVALVDNSTDRFIDFCRSYRDKYCGIVVGITGSVGKTTTKKFIRNVMQEDGSTFMSPANENSRYNVADNIINRMNGGYDVFIQESGAAVMGSVGHSARMLRPDIAVVTNVKEHHLSAYGSLANVFADKIQMVEQLAEGGTAVVNFDDKGLAEYDYKCRVASFGIYSEKELSYRAVNIEQRGRILCMDILHEGGSSHVESELTGEYNAYNILAAFAAGKAAGLAEEDIIRGIAAYEPVGTRQNIVNYAGIQLFVDCYNVCNETIINSARILQELNIEKGGRRIAIIGGENKLGAFRVEKTEELALELLDSELDEIVCYGTASEKEEDLNRYGDAATLYRTLQDNGFASSRLITDFNQLASYMRENIRANDAVLFKTIVYLNMPAAIDKAFGTGFCLNQRTVTKKAIYRKERGFTGFVVRDMNEVLLTDASETMLEAKEVRVPDSFCGTEVFGLRKGLFMYGNVSRLDLGMSLKHIGASAFRGCRNLKEVRIPDSVMYIGRGAFRECRSLSSVRIGRGIRHIESGAFAGCGRLVEIWLPDKDGFTVEEGAFPVNVIINKY